MTAVPGRALHYVFKIGDRSKNSFFFRTILGMQVLRHEEFKEGCDAECNGPYDNRWSKTMVGYGPEKSHFVIELTYNYGVKSYTLGNDFGGITIKSKDILPRASEFAYPITKQGDKSVLTSPDGYKFYIDDASSGSDPMEQVELHVTALKESRAFWVDILKMQVLNESQDSIVLAYNKQQTALRLTVLNGNLDRAKAYGRIAFAVPAAVQEPLFNEVKNVGGTILKPLIALETPGKATVTVLILADPNGHEICFVDEEGFSQLSEVEPNAAAQLDKYIRKDPFQDKTQQ